MHLRTYYLTGALITLGSRLFGLRIRATGLTELPRDRSVLFVANHFTRSETFLVPNVIHRRFRRRVKSLGTHTLFRGLFGHYLTACGVVSVRNPKRNRMIVGDLLTGRTDWVIYPEGGLVKTKKTINNGRLHVQRATREGPPHTGAAIMALKVEMHKRSYLEACQAGNRERVAHYQQLYGLGGARDARLGGTIVVPVTLTYPQMRTQRTWFHRLATLLRRTLHPSIDEELQVEGSILFRGLGLNVHFGTPIEVSDYLVDGRTRRFWRRDDNEPRLSAAASRLTEDAMRSIYQSLEINFDHLFCTALRVCGSDTINVRHLHRVLHLAALELREEPGLRLHPVLRNGIVALSAGHDFEPLDSVLALAESEGILSRDGDTYHIDRHALATPIPFGEIRLRRMVEVIANEVEPVTVAVETVRTLVNLGDRKLETRLSGRLRAFDQSEYHVERGRSSGRTAPTHYGEPFLLEHPRPKSGVVLVHGYLSCPEQMRPLAEMLYEHGHTVYVVRLDGHGTSVAELESVRWTHWLDAVARGCGIVRPLAPKTIVGGFSLGGILAVLHAAQAADGVDGLFTVNAPLRLRHPMASLVPAVVQLHDLAAIVSQRDTPRVLNQSENPDLNYAENDLRATRELRRAMATCRRMLDDVDTPTMVIQSDDDPVAHPGSVDLFRDGIPADRLCVIRRPGDRHIVVRGVRAPLIFDRIVRFVDGIVTTP